jgi:hypothetical protein
MGIKITDLPQYDNPSSDTLVLAVNMDSDPDQSVKVPLSQLGFGVSNGNFINLTSKQYAISNDIFIQITANSHTIEANNNGKILLVNNTYPTVLIVSSVDPGFSCSVIRLNNTVTFANGGMVINSTSNSVNISSQFSPASLMCYSPNTFILYGDIG